MTGSPYVGPVADLVDPYLTAEVKNIGGFKSVFQSNPAIQWLRRHPGRWALVAEDSTGLTRELLKICPDITVSVQSGHRYGDRVSRTYACLPHPEGESLSEAMKRRPVGPVLYLPEVQRDDFNWSKAELEDACRVAKANLFP